MHPHLNRYATPVTLGLFVVSTISGIALFFHFAPAVFHAMHEWLSLLLLLPFILHMWKNWPAMITYFRRRTLWAPLAVSLALAVIFAIPALTGSGGGVSPQRMAQLLTHSPLADLAPILKTTPEALLTQLRQNGYHPASAQVSLAGVASDAGVSRMKLLADLMSLKTDAPGPAGQPPRNP